MEYTIINELPLAETVKIDLPLEIARVDYSFEYYDNDLKKMRSTHPNHWVVNENEFTPRTMSVEVKEFKEVKNAVEHAVKIYLKYLRDELKRVRDAQDDE